MSRPWMPLYVADYLADTGHLSTMEHGAYLLLIMHYWQKGGLPDDDKRLASIARASLEQWSDMRDAIAEFFDAGWKHQRIDAELESAAKAYERRAAAGRAGGKAKSEGKQCSSNATAGLQQSQSQPQKIEDADASSSTREINREFEETFWPVYPLRVGKPQALKSYFAARKRASFDIIVAGAKRYAAERSGQDKKFTKQAQGWLSRDGWNDEPIPAASRSTAPPAGRRMNAVEAYISMKSEQSDEPASRTIDHRNAERVPANEPRLQALIGNLGAEMQRRLGPGNH